MGLLEMMSRLTGVLVVHLPTVAEFCIFVMHGLITARSRFFELFLSLV
jgi:hypothetical protein